MRHLDFYSRNCKRYSQRWGILLYVYRLFCYNCRAQRSSNMWVYKISSTTVVLTSSNSTHCHKAMEGSQSDSPIHCSQYQIYHNHPDHPRFSSSLHCLGYDSSVHVTTRQRFGPYFHCNRPDYRACSSSLAFQAESFTRLIIRVSRSTSLSFECKPFLMNWVRKQVLAQQLSLHAHVNLEASRHPQEAVKVTWI